LAFITVWSVVPSRAELARAHRFRVRRLINAVRSGRPDEPPSHLGAALVAGLAVAVLATAGLAIRHRLNRPDAWRDSASVIVERESGDQFVYADGRLHPVLNVVSARLAIGTPAPVVAVARSALRDVARGPAWGIAGAPDRVPAAAELADSWAVCSVDGEARLVIGVAVGGHRLGARGMAVSDGRAARLLVTRDSVRSRSGGGRGRAVASEFVDAIPVDSGGPAPAESVEAPGAVCVTHDGGGATVVVGADPPAVRVTVRTGSGAVLASDASPGVLWLVCEDGRRYALAGDTALASLGLSGVTATVVPPSALAMIPEGPRLSGDDARSPEP